MSLKVSSSIRLKLRMRCLGPNGHLFREIGQPISKSSHLNAISHLLGKQLQMLGGEKKTKNRVIHKLQYTYKNTEFLKEEQY